MKRLQRFTAALIALLFILTALTAFSVFAEGEDAGDEESSAVESSSSVEEEPGSSSAEETQSSSEEEKPSSSEEEKSSSSEESDSSVEEPESSSEESRRETGSSSESSAEETYAQMITDPVTGVAVGLSQPNDKLTISARNVTAEDRDVSSIYGKLVEAASGKEIVCCFEIVLGGDESFSSKVTVMLPVDGSLYGRSMSVLFYPEMGSHVEKSTKNVGKDVPASRESTEDASDDEETAVTGIIRASEKLEAGRKYYFAVCEVADFVPASNGLGLLGIMAILIGVMALASGGLLAFLWVRYNKKQQKTKSR